MKGGYKPQPMQSPAIAGPYTRIGIPELRLQKLSTRVDEAAAIGRNGRVVTGQRAVHRTTGCVAIGFVCWHRDG